MSHIIMLIPADTNINLTNISLGIIHSIKKENISLNTFKPIYIPHSYKNTINKNIITNKNNFSITKDTSLNLNYACDLLSKNKKIILMEKLIEKFYKNKKNSKIIFIEGLIPYHEYQFINILNYEIAKTLNAKIIFVIDINQVYQSELKERIKLIHNKFGGNKNKNILGIIINKFNTNFNHEHSSCNKIFEMFYNHKKTNNTNINILALHKEISLPILGYIPWNFDLITPRIIDIVQHLKARFINKGDVINRRLKSITFCTNKIFNKLKYFYSNTLLVISVNHYDILTSIYLSIINGVKIGAILLTDGYNSNNIVNKLYKYAYQTKLPIFIVNTNNWQTIFNLQKFNFQTPSNDFERIKKIKNYISNHINKEWIKLLSTPSKKLNYLSPQMFCYQLTQLAQKANKCIILPEGNELRTIKAANICAERNIAQCILLGNPTEIKTLAIQQNIKLSKNIKIINPIMIRKNYISRLLILRKNKGITVSIASKQLEDNVMLGTLMLEQGEVDGLVSGAINTTANTIRPALQLIKTSKGNSLISSIFFMLLPEQVLIYGDCAINPNPTAEQLSEIAIQSAHSAKAFGIIPRIAMISYSTKNSSKGHDVEKVRQATYLTQKKCPNLIIDGPLQYDASIIPEIAKSKAPNSPIAGQATIFIFPDLNTGNTTYKAVQRSANLMSIGPMLQGMKKPVNDLSRGALVEDIVYTIALTAIQALQT